MQTGITRRAILALAPGWLAAQAPKTHPSRSKPLPSVGEFYRFTDPTTENPVVRLTDPRSSSFLPAANNRFVSVRERFLLFSSDRGGKPSPFQVDLRSGVLRQIAETAALVPRSLCLDPKERILYFIDGGNLKFVNLGRKAVRESVETLAENVAGFSVGAQSGSLFIARKGALEQLDNKRSTVLAEDVSPDTRARPGGPGCLFVREKSSVNRELWYAPGSSDVTAKPVLLASGRISSAFWSPDGQSVLFLREMERPEVVLSEIHEVLLNGSERCVAPTSQFASFAPNGDASVFVGASRSKAQPNIVLLLRSVKRELTLCEHRSSHPADASPVFSPDSRRVYFESDSQGKTAIFSVNVELLVEPVDPTA